jgi:hypothetical protein
MLTKVGQSASVTGRRGLNHEIGEVLEGMDSVFTVSEVAPWAEQTRLTTSVEKIVGTKFKRKKRVTVPIWHVALEYAREAYANAGADPGRLAYDCIVQSYPRTGVLAFVFVATIAGEDKFVTAPFKLSDEQVADLTLRGLWQPYRGPLS